MSLFFGMLSIAVISSIACYIDVYTTIDLPPSLWFFWGMSTILFGLLITLA